MSEIEYDPSGKSDSSLQVGAEILNLLLYAYFIYFYISIGNKRLN